MRPPTKIPIESAYRLINRNDFRNGNARMDTIENLVDDTGLVPVTSLSMYFNTRSDFYEFKKDIDVTNREWQISKNEINRRYVNKYLKTKRRKRKLKMKAKLGKFRHRELNDLSSDESYLSISPSNDECDDEDVNLPRPICRGIRRICHNYSSNKRYKKMKPDHSENKTYAFRVKYR